MMVGTHIGYSTQPLLTYMKGTVPLFTAFTSESFFNIILHYISLHSLQHNTVLVCWSQSIENYHIFQMLKHST